MSGQDSNNELYKKLMGKLEEVINELPNGELTSLINNVKNISENQKNIAKDVAEIKETIKDPENGLIVRVNKNTEYRVSLEEQENDNAKILEEHQSLVSWKESVTKFLWLVATAILSILSKIFFFS